MHYTRWEIGGEPQRKSTHRLPPVIIPDGRSGGNRNLIPSSEMYWLIIPDGRSGGEPQLYPTLYKWHDDYTRWEIGGEPQH